MSAYREEKPLTEDDRFTFEDSQILKELRESDRLTEREKLAVQRLYRTYQYMVDRWQQKRILKIRSKRS